MAAAVQVTRVIALFTLLGTRVPALWQRSSATSHRPVDARLAAFARETLAVHDGTRITGAAVAEALARMFGDSTVQHLAADAFARVVHAGALSERRGAAHAITEVIATAQLLFAHGATKDGVLARLHERLDGDVVRLCEGLARGGGSVSGGAVVVGRWW